LAISTDEGKAEQFANCFFFCPIQVHDRVAFGEEEMTGRLWCLPMSDDREEQH
jgi:hypothetical protein